jgi:hypothetical protein
MVIVTGRPPDILTAMTRAPCERGSTARVIVFPESEDRDELVDLVWPEQPSNVIAVDALPSLAEEDPTAASDHPLLTAALRAAQSAAHPVLVWETFRLESSRMRAA